MLRLLSVGTILLAASVAPAHDDGEAGHVHKGDPVLYPKVTIETSLGDIVLELNAEKAPITVTNFIQYVQDGYFDNTIFHRVMKNFMIQGGGFTADMEQKTEGLRPGIKNEWKNGLKNTKGTISMARLGRQPDSATAQFFINVVDNASLDAARDGAAYAVFGHVVEGADTVELIRKVAVSTHEKYGRGRDAVVPVETILIKSVRLVGEFDKAKLEAAVAEVQENAKAEENKKVALFAEKLEEAKSKGVKTDSGLICYDITVGDGPTPGPSDKVEVHYTGWLTDGSKFDSSVDRGSPFSFNLSGGVIQGWLEGVATMKVGGKRTLVIPSDLGYGARGSGAKIPPNSTLVFDIELLAIK